MLPRESAAEHSASSGPTNDPNEDDLPLVSVSGEGYDARVSNIRKQLRVLLRQIILVAEKF
jgi:hypothetical protein